MNHVHPLFAAILDAHFPQPEPVLCCECDAPATHFTEPDADYDPHCDAHYAENFATCSHCGAVVPKDEIGSILVLPGTRLDPDEYEERCEQCCPAEPDDDCDRAYEAWRDRRDEERAGLCEDRW